MYRIDGHVDFVKGGGETVGRGERGQRFVSELSDQFTSTYKPQSGACLWQEAKIKKKVDTVQLEEVSELAYTAIILKR